MKKMKSLLAISLTLAIIVGSLVFATGVSAQTENVNNNVLGGEIPIVYAATNKGANTYAGREVDRNNGWVHGISAFDNKGYDRVDAWKPYLAKLTDNNADTTFKIKPMTYEQSTDDDVLLVYEIAPTDISSIEIDIASGSTSGIKVYAANTTAALYGTLVADIAATSSNIEQAITTVDTRYIAFVFAHTDLTVKDIKVFGNFEDKSTSPDVLAEGQIPISYVVHNPLGTTTARNVYHQDQPNGAWHPNTGYDKLTVNASHPNGYNYNEERIGIWSSITKNLTDNKLDTWLRAKPENTSNGDTVVIVFELDGLYKINGFEFDFYEGHEVVQLGKKQFKVYASDNSATLYKAESMIADVTTYDHQYRNETAVSKLAKYIAIQVIGNFCISEIAFNGESAGEDIIAGKTPIVYTTINSGTLTDAWRELECEGTGKQGIDLPNGRGEARVEEWRPYLSRFTDGNANNSFFIGARDATQNDDIKLVYEIPASKINGFSINVRTADVSKKTTGGIKVYAANSYADLEKESSVVATVPATTGSVISAIDPGELADAKYVMFAFTTPMIHVYELDLYGTQPYDVNEDNDVTIRDLVALYNIIKEGDSWDQCDMADLRESLLKS